jgi:hypothetical protein
MVINYYLVAFDLLCQLLNVTLFLIRVIMKLIIYYLINLSS